MIVKVGSQSGDASEATLQAILAAVEDQRDFEEQIWVDSTGTFYIRRVVYDPTTSTYTVSYTLANGSVYVPVNPSTPVGSSTDYEITKQNYLATAGGTGFSINDELIEILIVNTSTNAIAAQIWYNATTDATIAAPSMASVTPRTKYALESTLTTTNTKLDTINTTTGTVKTSVDTVNTTTGTVKTSVDTVNTTLGTTNTKLDTINTTTGTVKTSVDAINNNFVTDGSAISTEKAFLLAGQDGSNNQIINLDSSGRVVISPTTPAVAANSGIASMIVSENIVSGSDSSASITIPAGGTKSVSFTSNSGLQYEIRFSSGAVVKVIAGDSATIPLSQVAGVTAVLRPINGNMVSGTDVVRVTAS